MINQKRAWKTGGWQSHGHSAKTSRPIDPKKVQSRVENILGKPESVTGSDHNFTCCFCHQSHIHIDYKKNVALCHGCNKRYRNLYNLIRDLGGDLGDLRDRPAQDIDGLFSLFNQVVAGEAVNPCQILPQEFKRIFAGLKDEIARCMYNYMHVRGVSDQQLEDYGIGYCETGRYADMIVIPVYMNGKMVFFTTRRVFGPGKKTLNPAAGESKRFVLMGYEQCLEAEAEVIHIVEGPFDLFAVERAGLNGVAVMGSTITVEQAALLAKTDAELVVTFDPDAEDKAWKFSQILTDNCPNKVSVCLLKGDEDLGDLCEQGDSGLSKIRKALRKRTELDLSHQLEALMK